MVFNTCVRIRISGHVVLRLRRDWLSTPATCVVGECCGTVTVRQLHVMDLLYLCAPPPLASGNSNTAAPIQHKLRTAAAAAAAQRRPSLFSVGVQLSSGVQSTILFRSSRPPSYLVRFLHTLSSTSIHCHPVQMPKMRSPKRS